VLQLVVDRDAESISPCCMNSWAGILPVDEEADFVTASSLVASTVGDV
jgi:hypothetical protein